MKRIPIPHIFKRLWQLSEREPQVVQTEDKTGWGCTVADCSSGSLMSYDRDKIAKAVEQYPCLLRAVVDLVSVPYTIGAGREDDFAVLHGSTFERKRKAVLTALKNSGLNVSPNWKP